VIFSTRERSFGCRIRECVSSGLEVASLENRLLRTCRTPFFIEKDLAIEKGKPVRGVSPTDP
jgi:hypothetical protein